MCFSSFAHREAQMRPSLLVVWHAPDISLAPVLLESCEGRHPLLSVGLGQRSQNTFIEEGIIQR
jgi:hypothetical protein